MYVNFIAVWYIKIKHYVNYQRNIKKLLKSHTMEYHSAL